MDKALVTGQAEKVPEVLDGLDFERRVLAEPGLLERVTLAHPETGAPAVFVPTYYREGYTQKISAHFAHAKGFAPNVDHVFDNKTSTSSIAKALNEGKKILLSLNLDLSFQALDFSDDKSPDVEKIESWKAQNNYLSVSINDIDEVVSVTNMVVKNNCHPKEKVFATYGGGVVPYVEFYVGKREQELVKLYDEMLQGQSGINIGETRQIGFPKMMRLKPTQTTLTENGTKGIKGTMIQFNQKSLLNYVVLSASAQDEKRAHRASILERMKEGHKDVGVYVLASPTISIGQQADKPKDYWRNIRWVVNNPETQIRVPDKPQVLSVS